MKTRQENRPTKRGDRMPKTNFSHFTILLKIRLKIPNFVGINMSTDPIKSDYEGTRVNILRAMKKTYTSSF